MRNLMLSIVDVYEKDYLCFSKLFFILTLLNSFTQSKLGQYKYVRYSSVFCTLLTSIWALYFLSWDLDENTNSKFQCLDVKALYSRWCKTIFKNKYHLLFTPNPKLNKNSLYTSVVINNVIFLINGAKSKLGVFFWYGEISRTVS